MQNYTIIMYNRNIGIMKTEDKEGIVIFFFLECLLSILLNSSFSASQWPWRVGCCFKIREMENQTKWVTQNHPVQDVVGKTFGAGLSDHKARDRLLQHRKTALNGEVSYCSGILYITSQDKSLSCAFALYNRSCHLCQDFFSEVAVAFWSFFGIIYFTALRVILWRASS